MTVDSKISHI